MGTIEKGESVRLVNMLKRTVLNLFEDLSVSGVNLSDVKNTLTGAYKKQEQAFEQYVAEQGSNKI